MPDYLSDFSPKCMCFSKAFLSLCKSVVIYIFIPLSGIALLTGIGPELNAAMGEGSVDFGMLLDQFSVYLRNLMVYSIPLLILSVFTGLYEKGSYARIPFKFISSLYLALILLMFTKGGVMDVTIDGSSISDNIGTIKVVLEIKAYIYILAIIAALKGFLAFAEFSDHRKAYLERAAEGFNQKDFSLAVLAAKKNAIMNKVKRKDRSDGEE